MIVYDITNENSFLNLEKWHNKLMDSADENIVLIICGNKSDLEDERSVSLVEGKDFAEKKELLFIETSALESTNVEDAFLKVV